MIATSSVAAKGAELKTVKARATEYFISETGIANVKSILERQQPDGSWNDVDYSDRRRGRWLPRKHCEYTRTLAAAYRKPGSPYYNRPEVRDAALRGLEYWVKRDCVSPNWWHQSIGTPMLLCETILILGDELSPELLEKLRPILDRSELGMTAQNRVWVAGIHLLKGAIFQMPEWIEEGAAIIAEELRFAPPKGEGVMPDWSFHQHGAQLQFGNYGLAYFSDMTMWGLILHSTKYEFPPEKVAILTGYYEHGIRWILFQRQMDFSACGRQINPGQPQAKYRSALDAANRLNRLRGEKQKVTEANLNFSGSRYFPDSDFYVQRNGTECYWSVKMTSNRTVPSETVNSENQLARLAGHGATMFISRDRELRDIGGVWDWRKIPGITSVQDDSSLWCKNPGWRNRLGWVGGLSDGEIGFCAMDFDNGEVKAKKSYFFFGSEMVALGSGIHSESASPVMTTIAQHRAKAEDGEINFEIRLLDDGKAEMKTEERIGNWKRVTDALPAAPVKARIFSAVIDHGIRPEHASYAYLVAYRSQEGAYFESLPESSSRSIHAVFGRGALMVAFYEPGTVTLPDGDTLEAKQPALVMVRKDRIYAADPGRTRRVLDLVSGGKKYRLHFPRGAEAGGTVSIPR